MVARSVRVIGHVLGHGQIGEAGGKAGPGAIDQVTVVVLDKAESVTCSAVTLHPRGVDLDAGIVEDVDHASSSGRSPGKSSSATGSAAPLPSSVCTRSSASASMALSSASAPLVNFSIANLTSSVLAMVWISSSVWQAASVLC